MSSTLPTSSTAAKLWKLFSPHQRRDSLVLLVLMVIGMVLETLGIGLVIPVIGLMSIPDLGAQYPGLQPFLDRLGNPTRTQLVMLAMLTLVAVNTFKGFFIGYLTWRRERLTTDVQADFSDRLFAGYLRQDYVFHLLRNSAELIRNTFALVADIRNVVHQSLVAITEGLVLLGASALLMAVQPAGALAVVSTFGLAGWGFNHMTRTRLQRWGEERQVHEGLRIQHLQQGLGGAKDVKLLGREEDFLRQYHRHNKGSAYIGQLQATLQTIHRLGLELLAVLGLALLVFVMIGQGQELEALLPTLGLFAAAAFRMMPSVNRVLSAVQSVRFSVPVVDTMYSELQMLELAPPPERGLALPMRHALTLEGICFQYPSAEAPALREVTLSVKRGSSVGFVGGSGAGKSTLVDIILGLLTPDRGTVAVDGVDIQSNLRGWQDQVGYVPQTIFLTDDTLRRNIAFGLSSETIDEAAVRRALRSAQLEEFVDGLPDGLDTVVGERGIRLSGGQRQRIGIARALYHDPPVLVLDEATSSVDTATEVGIMSAVRALHGDKTILIVAHRLSTVEHCDSLFCLDQGRVTIEGEAAAVLADMAAATE